VRLQRRSVALLASVAGVALVATACGGSPGGSPNAGATKGSGDTGVKALDVNVQPRDKVADGGTLRWPIDQLSTQWNYNQLDGPNVATSDVMLSMMPATMVSNEKAVVTPDPNYVTSATVTSTSPQVVTYELNDKAKWSDGTPISVKDYEAQWNALNGTNPEFLVASTTGYELVSSVKAGKDDHEVVVTFAKPFADWRSLFSPLYPASVQNTPAGFNTAYLNKIPVTAGPFKLSKIDQTQKTVTVVPDPNWWGDKPRLDRIVFRAMEQQASIQAFANNELDVVNIGANAEGYKQASGVSGGDVREAAGPDYRHFTVNGTSPMLSDPAVRRAVAQGINRSAIAQSDLNGLNWPVRTMDNHFFVNSQEGYRDNSGDVGTYDPEKAKAGLDAAGWRLNGQFRQKDGRTLDLKFVIPTGVPRSKSEGELTQAMLADVGVKITIQAVPSDAFFDKYINVGNFDITPFSWIGTPFAISSAKSIYENPKKDDKGELAIQQNYARVGSGEIDALLQAASSELDVAKARDLINQADKLVWDEVHSLILYQRPQIYGARANLANVGAFGFKSPKYEDMGFVK
jgi:peptide/nickel transport system substrate-binding protein